MTKGVAPKVESAAWAGAVTVLLVWVAGLVGVEVPAEVASAVTVLVAAGAGYLAPPVLPNGRGEVERDPEDELIHDENLLAQEEAIEQADREAGAALGAGVRPESPE